jgi:hypothetical protein
MKRPRRGWRWWGKWVATSAAVLIAVVWFVSGWVGVLGYAGRFGDAYVSVGAGRFVTTWSDSPVPSKEGPSLRVMRFGPKLRGSWRWSGRWGTSPATDINEIAIPLWMPFLAFAASAAFLWRTDRHPFGS